MCRYEFSPVGQPGCPVVSTCCFIVIIAPTQRTGRYLLSGFKATMEIMDKGGNGEWIRRLGITMGRTKVIVGQYVLKSMQIL